MTDKAKQLGTSTAYRVRQYTLLVEALLLFASFGLAEYAALSLNVHGPVKYLAIISGVYALVEGFLKVDKAIIKR